MKPYGPPRPLRSQGVPSLRGDILTDTKILHYMKLGYYGEARRLQAEEELKARKQTKHVPRASPLQHVLDYLNE